MCSDAMKEDRDPRTTQDSRQRQLWQQIHLTDLKQKLEAAILVFLFQFRERTKVWKLFFLGTNRFLAVCHTQIESLKSIANWVKCLSGKTNKAALTIVPLVGAHITVTLSRSKYLAGHFAAQEVHWSSHATRSADSVCSISRRRHQRLSFSCQPERLNSTPESRPN